MESKTMKEDERIKKILKQRIVKIIENILNNKNVSEARGTLAEIRHCMVLTPDKASALWGYIYAFEPEQMTGRQQQQYEKALYNSLTFFALHQQSHDIKLEPMHKIPKGDNLSEFTLGDSVWRVAEKKADNKGDSVEEELERIKKRFNLLVTTQNFDDFLYYLRRMVSLLSGEGISLNYGLLAEELYDYQSDYKQPRLRLQWVREFYRNYTFLNKNYADDENNIQQA